MRSSIAAVCLLFMIGCGPEAVVNDYQIRVVWDSNPQNTASFVWTEMSLEQENSASSSLEIARDSDFTQIHAYDKATIKREQYTNHRLFQKNENPLVVFVKITDLLPKTTYYIRVLRGENTSQTYNFTTAPEEGEFTLLIGGDSRSDQVQRRAINHEIATYISANPQAIAFSHGGDYVADGSDWRQWSHWLNDWQLTYVEGKITPIIPTRGNHETDKLLYNQIFGYPGNEQNIMLTKIGALRLLTLNSEESVYGSQMRWLESELIAGFAEKDSWTVVNYHRPAYPAFKRPAVTGQWVPLFEKFGVRLALESDGHTFKKTVPIFEDKRDPDQGVIYLGEGGLGVKQRTPKTQRWYFQDDGLALAQHHFIIASVSKDSLELTAVNELGESFHNFTLWPRSR